MRHVLFVPDCVTTGAGDDIFGIDAEQLCDWSSRRCVIITLVERHENKRVMWESVAFHAEMVK